MIALQNMRMSCDSSYLLDQKSEHGLKADEFLTIAAEMLETPDARMVVFSQWVRMLELVAARLRRKRLGHVLFHGRVPGPKRKNLIKQFREDPDCRLFLSTDAGGVGLNLQHANAVVNLDLPWNPAVLEQRIGRVHRLGQCRPVQVVNLIAENTIEHGMLDVLAFKKGLFSGVLDGGSNDVFLGGTRLKRFLESVEKVSGAIPSANGGNGDVRSESPAAGRLTGEAKPSRVSPDSGGPGPRMGGQDNHVPETPNTGSTKPSAPVVGGKPITAPGPAAVHPDAAAALAGWQRFFTAGRELLDGMANALLPAGAEGVTVERDPRTGQSYVKLPLPSPDALSALETALKPSLKIASKAPVIFLPQRMPVPLKSLPRFAPID